MRQLLTITTACAMLATMTIQAQTHEMTVQMKKVGAPIQNTMYGLFFEDINFAADGGLYAELVLNRSFEFPRHLEGWKTVGNVTVALTIRLFLSRSTTLAPGTTSKSSDTVPEIRRCWALAVVAMRQTVQSRINLMILFIVVLFIGWLFSLLYATPCCLSPRIWYRRWGNCGDRLYTLLRYRSLDRDSVPCDATHRQSGG